MVFGMSAVVRELVLEVPFGAGFAEPVFCEF